MQSLRMWTLLTVLAAGLVTGCGKGRSSWIKGQVTFDKKAVQDGSIVLRPLDKTPGPAASAAITAGNYEIPKEKGLMAGKYLVLITATDNKGVQYIPDKYNVGSQVTLDVAAGANDKDFALERGEVTASQSMKGEEKLLAPPK